MPLTVLAFIQAKPEKEAEVEQTLRGLIPPTRSEEGCIEYRLHRSQETAGLFMFYENWVSREALDQHLGTPHLQAFASRAEELLDRPIEIRFYDELD